ncbi:MAG: UDP-N-acetylglucosamine 2-epimerase [bacterium]
MMDVKNVCVFTGTRAEYGLLNPLMNELKNDKAFAMDVMVTGSHLSPEFGLTYKTIEEDGFAIREKIEILLSSDTPVGLSKSMGLGMIGFSEAYERLKPDCIIILGDRYESLMAATAALVARIPIIHLYGGEVTFGVIDEAIRHSITKMSHIHFTSTEEYRKRVIQLGESPDRVFNVGAIGLDNIRKLKLFDKKKLEEELHYTFKERNFLVTYHPVTLEKNTAQAQFQEVLDVLDEREHTGLIFTKSNADTEGRIINQMIDEFVDAHSDKAVGFVSMGQLKYLSTLQFVDAVVGNSSSGIVEAPSFRIGTINIGDRQKGRMRAESIIDCEPIKKDMRCAFEKLYSNTFQAKLQNVTNPHGDGNTAVKIMDILKKYDLAKSIKKSFHDLEFKY